MTGAEYDGIKPVGLPPEWQLNPVDDAVAQHPRLTHRDGISRSKLLASGAFLVAVRNASVLTVTRRKFQIDRTPSPG